MNFFYNLRARLVYFKCLLILTQAFVSAVIEAVSFSVSNLEYSERQNIWSN